MSIIRELTFDGVVPNITVKDIEELFTYIERHFLKKLLEGIGLEVGAGSLTFSSILARRPAVEKIYGVEICQPIVEYLAPKIISHVLGDHTDKVIGAIGSFDDIQLADASVDFVFDFFSLHHSSNIDVTLKELGRVLKPGGFVLCLDKARPDRYTQEGLNELLDIEYPADYKRQFGLPPDQPLTRRMNGEREYRLKDWRAAFERAGFSQFYYAYLDRPVGSGVAHLVKNVLAVLPITLQRIINPILPGPRFNHKFILEPTNRIFAHPVVAFRKEMSLMIAYR